MSYFKYYSHTAIDDLNRQWFQIRPPPARWDKLEPLEAWHLIEAESNPYWPWAKDEAERWLAEMLIYYDYVAVYIDSLDLHLKLATKAEAIYYSELLTKNFTK